MLKQGMNKIPGKGGLIGALLGVMASVRYHRPEDNPLQRAGRTAVFSGAGYLLGRWFEKKFNRHRSPNTEP